MSFAGLDLTGAAHIFAEGQNRHGVASGALCDDLRICRRCLLFDLSLRIGHGALIDFTWLVVELATLFYRSIFYYKIIK